MSSPNRGPGRKPPPKRRVRKLGDFVLVKELGRGGMGVVYKARQESLGRFVALKVLPSFAGMDPSAVQRFRREAEACAKLTHPGIVPVYGVGEAEGVHYYAMEMVEGPSLSDLLDQLRGRMPGRFLGSLAEEAGIDRKYPGLKDPPGGNGAGARYARSCAALIADVANALAAAHANKIIHRDLKPSNVMIRNTGRVVLLDFGLARDEMEVGLTRSGDAVGTPSYMAPEQAAGQKNLDARVDIYGLGATLYELLTLEPPFDGAHAGEIMRKILDEDPRPVRMLNQRVPADLENIVLTCLAKDPEKRYPAIEALEMDLRAFLAGQEVEAKPPTRKERAARFIRRNRKAAVVAVATLVIAAGVGITAGVIGQRKSEHQGRMALAQARVQLLESGDVLKAKGHYGQAQVLLGDSQLVLEERRKLAIEAFEKFYPRGELDILRDFFRSIPEEERDGLEDYIEKVEGRGRLVVTGFDPKTASVSLKSFADGRLAPEWIQLPDHRRLPIGDYLLRVQGDGLSEVFRRVTVARDSESEVVLDLREDSDLPLGTVEVVDPEDGRSTAVSQAELSRGEYQGFLDGINEPAFLREMMPRDWLEIPGGIDQPARGLSFLQARAVAAHLGMHLLSEPEYRLAATAGLPQLYPWGDHFDASRMAADPDQLGEPESVLSRPSGASPLGVQHLLGNVSEILSPGADGVLPKAGGHFQTDPRSLRLDSRDLIKPLESIGASDIYTGTRLARFLPRTNEEEKAAAATARRAEILERSASSIFHDWLVAESGSMTYRLTVSGVHQNEQPAMVLPVVTTGFIQMGNPTVRDGHDDVLDVSRRSYMSLEGSELTVDLARPAIRGQGFRLQIDSWLVPVDGLSGDRRGYVLRVPVKAVGLFPTVHQVVLPQGCRVDERDPEPTSEYTANGQIHMTWEFLPDSRGTRTLPVVVRFRKDGMFTERWPVRQRVDAFKDLFFGARLDADPVPRDLVHRAYLQSPSGLDFDSLVSGDAFHQVMRQFDEPRLMDFTAVGPVVTLDLLTDWKANMGGRQVDIADWPLRVQALRDGGRYQAIRLVPRSRRDSGKMLADGTYVHSALSVRIPPGDADVNRTQEELTEMQLHFARERGNEGRGVKLQVLGNRARPGETADQMKVWLTGGAIALRPAHVVPGTQDDSIGSGEGRIEGRSLHVLFRGRGGWVRERWTFVAKGTRHFLIKAVAEGDSQRNAELQFEAERAWFERIAATIMIE